MNSVLGALEREEMDGQEESETPGVEGNTHRSDCNSGYLSSSGTGRGKDRLFPLIPHLVGSPFNTSNTSPPAINTSTPPSITAAAGAAGGAVSGGGTGTGSGTGGSSISPTSKSSPMRRLSNRLSERAIGLFGFLRGGSHHRSSASLATPTNDVDYLNGTRQTSILSSYNMNSRSHHFDAERTPLGATSSRKYSHYLDFESMDEVTESRSNRLASDSSPASFAGCSANRISKGIKAASRASLALSEDFDDLGTVTPFDPQSRHSSLYEITSSTHQQYTAPHSAYSSMLGIEQIQSPRGSIPSGTPNSSGNEIEIITDNDLIWDLPYVPYIPYDSPDQVKDHVHATVRADVHVNVHVDEQDIHPHDDLTSHTPTHSSPPFPTSPSKRRNGTRNGSLTSLTSIATTGSTSPEKYPYDKTAGWFNVGRSGFNKEKDKDKDRDRDLSIPSNSHLRLKDGTYTHVQ